MWRATGLVSRCAVEYDIVKTTFRRTVMRSARYAILGWIRDGSHGGVRVVLPARRPVLPAGRGHRARVRRHQAGRRRSGLMRLRPRVLQWEGHPADRPQRKRCLWPLGSRPLSDLMAKVDGITTTGVARLRGRHRR